jgi:hypothetical protein
MIALAVIVLVGTLLGAYERSQVSSLGGIAGLFCPPKGLAPDQLMTGTLGFFVYIFHLSKYAELVDTFILICKGKDLLFLHCYHHCSMLFVTWSWFAYPWLEGAWWCAVVNSIIHSFMYYYYLRTALPNTKVWWGQYLTSAQIFQVRLLFPRAHFLCLLLKALIFIHSFSPVWPSWRILFILAIVLETRSPRCSPKSKTSSGKRD